MEYGNINVLKRHIISETLARLNDALVNQNFKDDVLVFKLDETDVWFKSMLGRSI